MAENNNIQKGLWNSMIKNKRWLCIFSILMTLSLVISACQAQPTADPSTLLGKVLYEDNFSDEKSGWQVVKSEQGELGYVDGAYRILLNVPLFTSFVGAQKAYNDVEIEVDVTKKDGPDESVYGVICRQEDEGNFYLFVISSAGYYGIGKVYQGVGVTFLGSEKPDMLIASDAIKKGNETNHLKVVCADTTLSMAVNGKQLLSVQDPDIQSGDVGFIVKTFDKPGIDVRFDNFVVRLHSAP